jgi:hypothetical protein
MSSEPRGTSVGDPSSSGERGDERSVWPSCGPSSWALMDAGLLPVVVVGGGGTNDMEPDIE